MKKFLVQIWAYDYHAKFKVLAEDNVDSIEQSILDKIGEKTIKWEYMGENVYSTQVNRITYEEVINDATTSNRTIYEEKSSGPRMGAGAS